MLTLLECMKNNLPSNDGSKFKTTESHLDWEKVAFKDFSGEMCKMKWMEISNEVTDSRAGLGGVSASGTRHPGELPGLFESLKFSAPSPRPTVPPPSALRTFRRGWDGSFARWRYETLWVYAVPSVARCRAGICPVPHAQPVHVCGPSLPRR